MTTSSRLDSNQRHRVFISAFLPLPELVTHGDDLRQELVFLSDRDELWGKFQRTLVGLSSPDTNLFVNSIGRLRWRLTGDNLRPSLHQVLLRENYNMRHRMPIPLVAVKTARERFDGTVFNIVRSVRIYPTLYAEYRLKISTPAAAMIPEDYQRLKKQEFDAELKTVQRSLYTVLFGRGTYFRRRFSRSFTVELLTDWISWFCVDEISVTSSKPRRTTLIEIEGNVCKRFVSRAIEAAELALAQRVIAPVLWTGITAATTTSMKHIRELMECVFVSHNPDYYTGLSKLHPFILPSDYQRVIFRSMADILGLYSLRDELQNHLVTWLSSLPRSRLTALTMCTPPLKGTITAMVQRIAMELSDTYLRPPAKTVFDYLVLAHLRDTILMTEDPQRYRIPDDRLGRRSANMIDRGTSKLEEHLGSSVTHKRSDLYPVPGPALQALMQMGLIKSVSSHKTSARMQFQVNLDKKEVLIRIAELTREMDESDIIKLGV